MFNVFSPKCPNCGQAVSRQASFCPVCGQALASASQACGVCGTQNRNDARFCRKCGRPLKENVAPEIQQQHWARQPEEFAVRIEANDLPGILRRGLIVEPGCNAMLVVNGGNQGVVPPGEYTLDTLSQKIGAWVSGVSEQVTALLVDITPTDLEFNLGGRFTRDPLPIGVTIRLRVEVSEPAKFLVNVLKGGERFTKNELRQYLYPEIIQIADNWLRQHTLEDLIENPRLKSELELAIEDILRQTFTQSGLRFLQVRTVELNLEPYDQIKGIRGQTKLKIYEAEARSENEAALADIQLRQARTEVAARQNFADIQHQVDLQSLAEETRKAEVEERKAELYQRMRQIAMSGRINEIQSQADLERFIDETDRQKLLRENERAELIKSWNEAGEDRQRARAHVLARLEVERDFELRMTSLRLQHEQDVARLDNEIIIARKRSDFEFDVARRNYEEQLRIDQEQCRIDIERKRVQIEIEQLQQAQARENDRANAMLGLEILAKNKDLHRLDEEETRRIRRQDDLERAREMQKIESERIETEERHRQTQREFELRRIEKMGQLGSEALISLSGPEQAQILADLKKTELLHGMSEDQILAAAAKESPEVARALAEKFRLLAEGNANEHERGLYERLLSQQKDILQQLQQEADRRTQQVSEAWDRSSQRAQQTSERALDRMSDTAQAFAHQTNPPIIVVPGGNNGMPMVTSAGMTESFQAQPSQKSCINCGHFVEANTHFCPYCGHKFEGVNPA